MGIFTVCDIKRPRDSHIRNSDASCRSRWESIRAIIEKNTSLFTFVVGLMRRYSEPQDHWHFFCFHWLDFITDQYILARIGRQQGMSRRIFARRGRISLARPKNLRKKLAMNRMNAFKNIRLISGCGSVTCVWVCTLSSSYGLHHQNYSEERCDQRRRFCGWWPSVQLNQRAGVFTWIGRCHSP